MKPNLKNTVSCFKDYETPGNPRSISLLTWLKSDKYADRVEQIRTIEDKEKRDDLKATLPAITPSGVFKYRNSDPENFIQHSGFLQFDIDGHDHTHIGNFDQLKKHLTNIQEVAYCGLSVSGRGYWGLIPIAYPERHTEQFWALYHAFKKLGLTLDTNPQARYSLRGYSYDPEGYFNFDAKVFEAVHDPEPRPAPQYRVPAGNSDSYGQAAFTNEIDTLSSTGQGNRNNQLFKSSAALASLVAGGVLDHHEVEQALFDTALSIGLKQHEIRRTIQSGFTAGFKTPRSAPQADHTPRAESPAPDPILKQIVETFDCELQPNQTTHEITH